MSAIRRIITYPLRRWRTLGFGVHSPFAFTMMTKVIGERSSYSCYSGLPENIHRDKRRRLRLLIRLICRFHPQKVAYTGADRDVIRAIRLADSRIELTDGAADMVVADTPDALRPQSISPLTVVLCNGRKLGRKPSKGTMTFTDGRTTIVFSRHDLPAQRFKFSLR